ncbi:MAG: hypothetical protein ACKOXR_07335, partial [Bacteroidota bacterium]
MKQRRLLTGIAIFIALYMTAALGWWTYSLLKYSVAESELQLELLENKKLLCYQKFQSENSGINPQKTTDFFSYKIKTTDFNSTKKSAEICAKYYQLDLQLEATPITADSMVIKVVFSTPKATIERINQRLNSKQMAWLGEGVTVGLITLIIIGLMYYYLEKIIRFNQQKTNFMMAVTHELKTPIAAAKLAIQTVIRN